MWLDEIADKVLLRNKKSYTLTTSVSPTGYMHIGKLRDIILVYFLEKELLNRGKQVNSILFWDDFDVFHKGTYSPEITRQFGIPLSHVLCKNDTFLCDDYKRAFLNELNSLDIEFTNVISQSKEYLAGKYFKYLMKCEEHLKCYSNIMKYYRGQDISQISFRSYCPKCWKVSVERGIFDNVCCQHCGNKLDNLVCNCKLPFRIEWAARWAEVNSDFEPIGRDHSIPKGVYYQSFDICKELFGVLPPESVSYEFVGFENSKKFSVSSGDAELFSITNFLKVFPKEIILWLFFIIPPKRFMKINILNKDEYLKIYKEYFQFIRVKKNSLYLKFNSLISNQLVPESSSVVSEVFNFLKYRFDGKTCISKVQELFASRLKNPDLIIYFINWQNLSNNVYELQTDKTLLNKLDHYDFFIYLSKLNSMHLSDLEKIEKYTAQLDSSEKKSCKEIIFGKTSMPPLSKMLYTFFDNIFENKEK